jgi:predicted metal-dependent HD superfamily phosphohydrolase
MSADLCDGWMRLAARLGCSGDKAKNVFESLAIRYSEPGRHYHNLDHVRHVLNTAAILCDGPIEAVLELAIWFHDAVYDPRAKDNEEKSAVLAIKDLNSLAVGDERCSEVARLVRLTQTHLTTFGDRLGQILLDADLAILGADSATYECYAAAIRREFAWVPEVAYRRGRQAVLAQFLKRPQLYFSSWLHPQIEAQARHNLRCEIDFLALELADMKEIH